MHNYDIIIAGAGFAGCLMAINCARQGLSVLMLDRKQEDQIGQRAGVESVEVDTFSKCSIPMSCGDEFIALTEIAHLFTPIIKAKKTFHYSNIIVNGSLLSQRLLGYVRDAGATIKPLCEVQDIILENDIINGLITSEGEELRGKIIVDAGGVEGAFRRFLPDSMDIEKEFKDSDIALGYKEVRPDNSLKPNEMAIYLGLYNGYVWRSPFDIGMGTFDYDCDIKNILYKFIEKHIPENSPPKSSFLGKISVRQNINNMVADNLIIIGEASCAVNTLTGSGIKSSMLSAKLAAEIAVKALECEDTSRERLWEHNVRYHREIGYHMAYMDILRRGMLSLKPDDMEFMFHNNLIKSDDIYKTLMGQVVYLNNLERLLRAGKGITRPHILLTLNSFMDKARLIRKLYQEYPLSYNGFADWKKEIDKINTSI